MKILSCYIRILSYTSDFVVVKTFPIINVITIYLLHCKWKKNYISILYITLWKSRSYAISLVAGTFGICRIHLNRLLLILSRYFNQILPILYTIFQFQDSPFFFILFVLLGIVLSSALFSQILLSNIYKCIGIKT